MAASTGGITTPRSASTYIQDKQVGNPLVTGSTHHHRRNEIHDMTQPNRFTVIINHTRGDRRQPRQTGLYNILCEEYQCPRQDTIN